MSNQPSMSVIRTFLLVVFIVVGSLVSAQDLRPSTYCGEVVEHQYYSLSYCEDHEQAEWVYYLLSSSMLQGTASRSDNFRSDPFVYSGSAALSDYKGSGYDRGHLAPAADMKVSGTAMSESFFLSNMSPQSPALNRGAWKQLEELFRAWAVEHDSLYIVTGPIFMLDLGSIGFSNVTIPSHYYKLAFAPDDSVMIAFILPNQKVEGDLIDYVSTVDLVEERTQLDFFPALPDSLEERLESSRSTQHWSFDARYSPPSASPSTSHSQQCLGTAKSTGRRCRNTTRSASGYCHVHEPGE